MRKVKLTITDSNCRGGYFKKDQEQEHLTQISGTVFHCYFRNTVLELEQRLSEYIVNELRSSR